MMRRVGKAWIVAACLAVAAGSAVAQASSPGAGAAGGKPATAAAAAKLSEHERGDIQRHRAMAAAHEAAARCLEAGRGEAACVKDLQAACKGLGIGKYCGMKHEH